MKLAISGKGGVGKSTLAAALAILLARSGRKVLAIDSDPNASLAGSLGLSVDKQKTIVPISEQISLIEERTGAKVKQYGQMFKINPEVSDIAEKCATIHNGIALLVLGAVKQGGSGCACPENIFIRALVSDVVLYKNDALIMDMEAGVEHLGRATASGVDLMLIVVEPGQRSIDCAKKVVQMAGEIGLKRYAFVLNKIKSPDDEEFIRNALGGNSVIGVIPYSDQLRLADRNGKSVLDELDSDILKRFEAIMNIVESGKR
ncbi:MAG: hypothetical protein A2Y10_18740 [Planctomycetes bacterium GWF2_41_51]|nr:MAG: hypothetical protein A2Y10_18740 [Planctomycetes bacterium GWF2_41_51]HBG27114.1 carbon monoxide dehydrogenase [Phycisphaerales bacterium]